MYHMHSIWYFCSRNVIACAKHFVGDGGTENGQNEGNTVLDEKELERIHMAPYLDCLEKGVCMVMVSYSSWNRCKMHINRKLLTDVLKDKLEFKVRNLDQMQKLWDIIV